MVFLFLLLFLSPLAESLAAGQPVGSLPTSQFQQVLTLHPWDLLQLCLFLAPLLLLLLLSRFSRVRLCATP